MKYYYVFNTHNKKLKENEGCFVIYDNFIIVAYSHTMNHDYLLESLAHKHRLNKEMVIKEGQRFYITYEEDEIYIYPARKVDDKKMHENWDKNAKLIKNNIK